MELKSIFKSNSTLSFLGNLVISIAGMVNFMLIARLVSTDELGQYAIFLAASTFLEMIRLGLTHNGLIRFIASGTTEDKNQYIGTAYIMGLVLAIFLAFFFILLAQVGDLISLDFSAYQLFIFWYPFFSVATFPLKNALTLLQADLNFGRILVLKILNVLPLSIVLVVSIFYLHSISIDNVMLVMVLSSGLLSLVMIFLKLDGSNHWRSFKIYSYKKLVSFGKYNSLTLLGTNLLQSVDMFLIGLSPLGPVAVAIYSIPLKYVEIMQMPLRSLAAAAYPLMARFADQNDWNGFRKLLYSRSGFLLIGFAPICVLLIFLAPLFIRFIAGNSFYEANGDIASDLLILFAIVSLFMPLDKFTGAALDAMNRPRANTVKVFIMLGINVLIDVIALWSFNNIQLMAVGSIVYTLVGGLIGYYYLKDKFNFSLKEFLTEGFLAINILVDKLRLTRK